jgi:large conductance mechanosensitive channel
VFEFMLIALALFLLIKGINRLKRPPQAVSAPAPVPSRTEMLLEEIRNLLARR